MCVCGREKEGEVKSRTFDSNSNRINIFDIFENSPPSSTFSDSEPSLEKIIEEDAPSPKKKAELYQWLNTSYYGSMIRKVSSQTPYQPDYVRIEDSMTVPIFEKEEIDDHGAGMETNSLLNEHKVQIDPQLSSTAPGSRSSETYELCKSCRAIPESGRSFMPLNNARKRHSAPKM
ncbi:Protein CBG20915 [Caenorhabditis briggsae]|uniref:Protein CBG20915 n=1 Tax=Caenorhabditis briggsae TaxID=6238 RepID=A8XYY0_CAEBR|nr:Protein CBG20915 [Caenorhabditis briggsae]CAP37847.2 Protein CBG20915 [Caenorhabditis briggsae]